MAKSSRCNSKKKSHALKRNGEKFKKTYKDRIEKMLSSGPGPNMLIKQDEQGKPPCKNDSYVFERENLLKKDLKTLTTKNIKVILKNVPDWDKSRLSRQIKRRRKVQKAKIGRK